MSPESDTDFGIDCRPRRRFTMSTPVHGCNQLRFHSGPGRMFPAIDRHEPGATDSRQGAILTEQSKSATAEDPPFISTFMGLGADCVEMANERVLSQTVGSRSPRIVASGWSV